MKNIIEYLNFKLNLVINRIWKMNKIKKLEKLNIFQNGVASLRIRVWDEAWNVGLGNQYLDFGVPK